MSYLGLNPAQLGVLIPQDPLTGALRIDEAITFDLLTSVSFSHGGSVARHPIQAGSEGPTDAIHEEPSRCSLSGSFVDKPLPAGRISLPFPFSELDFSEPDRCLAMGRALAELKAKRQLVTAVLPMFVLADRAIATLELSPDPAGVEVSASLTLEHVRVVSLTLVPAVADSDSKALGLQTTEIGFGGGRAYTGPLSV